jgi:hypothetical protein
MRLGDHVGELLRGARAKVTLARAKWTPVPADSVTVAESPPDTPFAGTAHRAARAASSDTLLAHCLRTWLWADLVAQVDRVEHDRELLYAACMLHDLGLTPGYWCVTDSCFAVEGARAAHAVATQHGYPRADLLANAISLHLNVIVPLDLGAEAHLLQAGAAMDVLATRLAQMPAPARAEVLARHPRGDFAEELIALNVRQRKARPRARMAQLQRLGLAGLARAAEREFH